jgi:hypothetical protein
MAKGRLVVFFATKLSSDVAHFHVSKLSHLINKQQNRLTVPKKKTNLTPDLFRGKGSFLYDFHFLTIADGSPSSTYN